MDTGLADNAGKCVGGQHASGIAARSSKELAQRRVRRRHGPEKRVVFLRSGNVTIKVLPVPISRSGTFERRSTVVGHEQVDNGGLARALQRGLVAAGPKLQFYP